MKVPKELRPPKYSVNEMLRSARIEGYAAALADVAAWLRAQAAYYPEHVFLPPDPATGHARTPDGCAAHTLRGMLPRLAETVERGEVPRKDPAA